MFFARDASRQIPESANHRYHAHKPNQQRHFPAIAHLQLWRYNQQQKTIEQGRKKVDHFVFIAKTEPPYKSAGQLPATNTKKRQEKIRAGFAIGYEARNAKKACNRNQKKLTDRVEIVEELLDTCHGFGILFKNTKRKSNFQYLLKDLNDIFWNALYIFGRKQYYMNVTPAQISELIKKRRAIFPKMFNQYPIPKEIIEVILENANWAPTHRLTEPWRFKVFTGKALERLGQYMGDYYKQNTPPELFSEEKYKKNMENPQRSACVIAICMQRDAEERVPEWEEIAAVACAVQNMWLTCTAYGIGSYWSTPAAALNAHEFLGLNKGEKCLGLFYMGYHDMPELPGKRTPIEEKTGWMEE